MTQQLSAAQRREALAEHVRDGIRSGLYAPGVSLPGLRELGAQFDLSRDTAQNALRPLIEAGILTSTARTGVFVSDQSPPELAGAIFVLLTRSRELTSAESHIGEIQRGFERRVSERGGVSLVSTDPDPDRIPAGTIGVFEFVEVLQRDPGVPVVSFRYGPDAAWPYKHSATADRVAFDEIGGGRDAANHLLERGFRRVGFLSRHLPHLRRPGSWAGSREEGWRTAVREATGCEGVCIQLAEDDGSRMDPKLPRVMADVVARRAIDRRHEFDAFVGVDDWSISAFLREWAEAGLPQDQLPAMVGFEDLPEARSPYVTSVQPPWDGLGEVAADLIWQRAVGQIDGGPVSRAVPMNIAARLSSRPDWRLPSALQLQQ